ncbi:ecto-ADP-ribosyltransferase 5 isoform X1 [Monodelphis domestica]|uniref:NAD(P)(+)--arginine ADP-ribosyltransferase n=2 Tax=Monodelphis domestica TaxID=13616 RepID=F7A3I9_MONDO|nr:ecto-ADP-ribosyltransferase 5 isoform X1 [Monodelphis domestica]
MLPTLMIALSCLGLSPLIQAQVIPIVPLGPAPNTFDDAYLDCEEQMEKEATHLLQEEMARHSLLRESWGAATVAWESRRKGLTLPMGFGTQHAVAIMVYTNSSNPLYQELNSAVRTAGSSREDYMKHFPFKALHFYLMQALQLLRASKSCQGGLGQEVFRGVSTLRFQPHQLGDVIRLGQFTSTSEEKGVAQGFGNSTFFTMSTCFGVPIQAFSVFPEEREVLIPPHEVFLVSGFSHDGVRNLVTIRSLNRTCSHFNCAYLGGEKKEGCVSNPGQSWDAFFPGSWPQLMPRTLLLPHGAFQLSGPVP